MPLYFKDESCLKVNFKQLVILCPKVYSILAEAIMEGLAGFETNKCKGVPEATAKRHLNHEKYLECLRTEKTLALPYHQIKLKNCRLTTEEMERVALNCSENKRFWWVCK